MNVGNVLKQVNNFSPYPFTNSVYSLFPQALPIVTLPIGSVEQNLAFQEVLLNPLLNASIYYSGGAFRWREITITASASERLKPAGYLNFFFHELVELHLRDSH